MKLLITISLLFMSFAHADDSLSTKIHDQYTSLRAMGMGNAFTAVADDYSLMFYNPAGFAKKRYNEVQFSLVGGGVAPKTLTLIDDMKKASETGTDSQKAAAVSAVLEQYYGKSLGGFVQAAEIFWTRKNWGVALLPANVSIDMSFNRQLGPAIDLNVIADTTIAYGYGTEYNKNLSLGGMIKYVHRDSVDQSVSALELASDPNVLSAKRFKEGNSIDADFGILWTPDWFLKKPAPQSETTDLKVETKPATKVEDSVKKEDQLRTPQAEEKTAEAKSENLADPATAATPLPESPSQGPGPVEKSKEVATLIPVSATENYPLTFGLVLKNIAGGSFSKSKIVNKDAVDVPTAMYRTIDFGSHYEFAKFGNLTLRGMIDFKNMLHPDITLNKSFHAGVEFDYFPNSWFKTQFRAGLNQMYFTGGATFLFGVLHIDAVTYGEEVGTISTKMENRVYAAKLGFNF